MTLAVECTYPIPEATTSGLLFVFGQFFGFLLVELYTGIAASVDKNSTTYKQVQQCTADDTESGSFTLSVLNYNSAMYTQTGILFVIAVVFCVFFKCPYLRLNAEKRLETAEEEKQQDGINFDTKLQEMNKQEF